MDTPPNNTSPVVPEQTTPPSFLDQIIQTSQESSLSGGTPPVLANTGGGHKPRDPMTTGMVLKLIGSLVIVAVIFFGSFLAYVVFNPDQAAFFVNIFGIDPNDIQTLLKNLINGSFGITVLIFSIVWIVSLFRAIWTPRDQKRRRLIGWLMAGIIGIFLFTILAFWTYLFNIINATDYANPGGNVTIYDNDLYTHNESRDYARIWNTTNLIGPITLKYDLSTNVRAIAKKNLLTIESYEINFDGAKCNNNTSIMIGSDPSGEQGLICTFDQIRTYNIRGYYTGKDRLGDLHTITIPLNTVEIKGLLDISSNMNKAGNKVMTINASKVKNLGNPRWQYEAGDMKTQTSITETITNNPIMICLIVIDTTCDRYFIIMDSDANAIEGSLLFNKDSTNSLSVTMSLTGINISDNEIIDIEWMSNDGTRLCHGITDKCKYTFVSYGTKMIVATIQLANKQTYKIEGTIILNEPLIITRHAEIRDKNGKLLNPADTFDPALSAYVIRDIAIPAMITLDAQNVVTQNLGYNIRDVIWKISNGKSITELIGGKVSYNLLGTERYTIEVTYTFQKNIVTSDSDIRTARDIIILDLERKSLEPRIAVLPHSDYTPIVITVDASLSRSKNGEIKKFIFDFGEGKPQTEGDAIQTYEYKTPGEKNITLTIIDSNNERATTTITEVLKDTPKGIGFTTTWSPGVIATPIDFSATADGDIEEWIWNFDDNTPISKGSQVTHTFVTAGTYDVKLTVIYTNGTQKSSTQQFQVNATLE